MTLSIWQKRAQGIVRHRWSCVCCGNEYGEPDRRSFRQGFCRDCAGRNAGEGAEAISKVLRAVLQGKLPRAKDCQCVDCGKQALDWDHRDYTKPLDVSPVCRSCNMKRGRAFDSVYRPELERQQPRPAKSPA